MSVGARARACTLFVTQLSRLLNSGFWYYIPGRDGRRQRRRATYGKRCGSKITFSHHDTHTHQVQCSARARLPRILLKCNDAQGCRDRKLCFVSYIFTQNPRAVYGWPRAMGLRICGWCIRKVLDLESNDILILSAQVEWLILVYYMFCVKLYLQNNILTQIWVALCADKNDPLFYTCSHQFSSPSDTPKHYKALKNINIFINRVAFIRVIAHNTHIGYYIHCICLQTRYATHNTQWVAI